MPAQQTHPGFNTQNSYDPFLGPNASEENLVAVHSDYTPSHQSIYSPTPEPANKINDGRSTRATSESVQGLTAQGIASNSNYTTSPPNSLGVNGDWDESYDFLTPNAYLSDNGYSASNEHTPEQEPLYLGPEDFALLENANRQPGLQDLNSFASNGAYTGAADSDINHFRPHRPSTGTATLTSSHLMSPELTDATVPSPPDLSQSPPAQPERLKREPRSREHLRGVHQAPQYMNAQQTPPLTSSSHDTSPDMFNNAGQSIPRAPSPMIRVDQITRGDSPARHPEQKPKRNRRGSFSSHLSVQATAGAEDDDDERFYERGSYDPTSRAQISNAPISNLRDQEEEATRAFKNADVADWIVHNVDENAPTTELLPERPQEIGRRPRARSAGAQRLSKENLESLETTPVDAHIPGPGLLLDESSGAEDSDYDSAASIEDEPLPEPHPDLDETPRDAKPGEYDDQPIGYRPKLWQDAIFTSSDDPGVKMQPISSNEAIMRFQQRNADIETVSRVATWGTRRYSDSDMASLFRRFTLTSVKEEEKGPNDEKRRERSGSIFQRFKPRRGSTLRRKESAQKKQNNATAEAPFGLHSRTSSQSSRHDRHDSLSVPNQISDSIKRMGSLKRPKSPKLDTSSAVAAMANPLAAVGGSSQFNAEVPSPTGSTGPSGPFTAARNAIRRSRSRSELNKSNEGTSSLAGIWARQGGPPMPNLVAPKAEESNQFMGDDDEDDEDADDPAIKMDLAVKMEPIIPTLYGFRDHVRQLNPRLPSWLVDRVAQEQLRRYKRLLDCKVKHVAAIQSRKCASGKHCVELGGEPTYLDSKGGKEPDQSQAFSIAGDNQSDEEANALAEGIVTPAQFPSGVPLPPIKRLPAEFECSLCFKVKKFNKPSDWSKHVHEDVQPFTCTFQHCAEPKSFKRKADWVRHENERHRQLEWWQCNIAECSHRCYRKDNFVQHLVREHKLPEPKSKTVKAGKPAVRGPSAAKSRNKSLDAANPAEENDQVWRMVETCRFDTAKGPKDEPCKFCGNLCPSWKKLTVHLAKHMEQIGMPVLSLVSDKEVTPDTIISPIENTTNRITSQQTSMSPVDETAHHQFPLPSSSGLPGGFVPSQGYVDQQQQQYERVAPYTYPGPRPQPHFAQQYQQLRAAAAPSNPHMLPPTHSHFDPSAHNPRAFATQQTSSPDHMYGLQAAAAPPPAHIPTSQPHHAAYPDAGNMPYVQHQHQVYTSSPDDSSVYQQYGATTAGGSTMTTPVATNSYPGGTNAMYAPPGTQALYNHPQQQASYGAAGVDHTMQGYDPTAAAGVSAADMMDGYVRTGGGPPPGGNAGGGAAGNAFDYPPH